MISVADARKARDAAEADVQKKTAARAEALAAWWTSSRPS